MSQDFEDLETRLLSFSTFGSEVFEYTKKLDVIQKRFHEFMKQDLQVPDGLDYLAEIHKAYLLHKFISRSNPYLRDTFLFNEVIDNFFDRKKKIGNCLGLTCLYTVLALREGFNIKIQQSDTHVKPLVTGKGFLVSVEATHEKGFCFADDLSYRIYNPDVLIYTMINSIDHFAGINFREGNYVDSIYYLTLSIGNDCDSSSLRKMRAIALAELGNFEEAIEDVEKNKSVEVAEEYLILAEIARKKAQFAQEENLSHKSNSTIVSFFERYVHSGNINEAKALWTKYANNSEICTSIVSTSHNLPELSDLDYHDLDWLNTIYVDRKGELDFACKSNLQLSILDGEYEDSLSFIREKGICIGEKIGKRVVKDLLEQGDISSACEWAKECKISESECNDIAIKVLDKCVSFQDDFDQFYESMIKITEHFDIPLNIRKKVFKKHARDENKLYCAISFAHGSKIPLDFWRSKLNRLLEIFVCEDDNLSEAIDFVEEFVDDESEKQYYLSFCTKLRQRQSDPVSNSEDYIKKKFSKLEY